MAAEMVSLQDTVAFMLKESLEKALNTTQKHLAENGNILQSLKEQADIHAKSSARGYVWNGKRPQLKWLTLQVPTPGNITQLTQFIMEYDKLELKSSEYTDHTSLLDIENDKDLDNHFYSNINDNCYYYRSIV